MLPPGCLARPNNGKVNEGNVHLLQKDLCTHYCVQCHRPCSRPLSTHPPLETPGHSQATLAHSLVGTLLLSPDSWCAQGFVCAHQESVSQFCGNSVSKTHWPPKSNSLGVLSPFARSPGWEICCGS